MAAGLRNPVPLAVLAVAGAAAMFGLLAGFEPKYAIGATVGLVFVVATFSNVAVGLCMLAALAILDAQGALGVAKLAGAVLAVSWLLAISTRRLKRASFAESHLPLAYALFVFLGWIALSSTWAENPSEAMFAVQRYAPNLLLIPICFDALQERRHAVWLLATIAGAAVLAAFLGILTPPATPAEAEAGRAAGTFGDANQFAAGLVAGLPIAAVFAMRRATPPGWRLLAGLGATIMVFAIFSTLSRGGLVALAAALPAAVIIAGRWRARVVAAGLALLGMALVYFTMFASLPARERVTNVGGGTGRLDLWTVGGRMVEDNPLIGVGAGNFTTSSVHYLIRPGLIERGDFIISQPKVAHNTYLQVAAELGIPIAALWIGIILFSVGCAAAAARVFARSGDESLELLARGVFVSLVGYLAAIMFISEMYSKLLWLLLAVGPALLAVARHGRAQGPGPERR
jgi:O-antigen ligase